MYVYMHVLIQAYTHDFESNQIACCTILPDWALYQIGQFGLRARLPDWSVRQIGCFFIRGVRQSLCLSRPPDWAQCQIVSDIICLHLICSYLPGVQ